MATTFGALMKPLITLKLKFLSTVMRVIFKHTENGQCIGKTPTKLYMVSITPG